MCSSKNKAAHFKTRFQKKQVALGLLAVLGNVPDAALPPQLGSGLPQLLSGLVRVLLDLKEQQDEAAKRGDSEEDDEGPVSSWENVCLPACLSGHSQGRQQGLSGTVTVAGMHVSPCNAYCFGAGFVCMPMRALRTSATPPTHLLTRHLA